MSTPGLKIPMSREEFASVVAAHPDQISRYVTAGILDQAICDRIGKRYKIDYVIGKQILDAYRDDSKSRTVTEPDSDFMGDVADTIELKKKKLHFEAQLKELEYRRELGELVEASVIEKEAFDEARLTRDRLLQIPDRVAVILAAETDSNKVFIILRDEINSALEMLSNG